ncbi:HutD [compost metagenome]
MQSIEFSGDSVVICKLLAGHIRDFNLIYNPKKFDAQYQWIFSPEVSEIPISSDLIFIFNQSVEALVIEIDQQTFHLQHQDSLKLENEKSLKAIILNQQFLKQTCLIQLTKI